MSHYGQLSVVVLGSGGFVGRHVCAAFARRDARVLGIVRSGTGQDTEFPTLQLDMSRAPHEQVAEVVRAQSADVVVNAAGAVWGVTDDQLVQSNVELTRRLIAALLLLDRRPRLVHLGSVQEYGPGRPGSTLGEDEPPRPVNSYGRSKLLATEAVLAATRQGQLDGVVLRIANVCGPSAPRGSLLGMIAAHLAAVTREGAGRPVPALRLSPLRARRDFIDVRDVADAVVATAGAELNGTTADTRLINIGRGTAVSVRGLVNRLIALSGLDTSVIEEHEAQGGRAGAEWQQVDIARARRILDWQPSRPLEQSLRDLLAAAQGR
ncbi:NAD(P)-dependent oxidoreductase [Streptomyces nondiastaticus]|uniref:NAD-dependent epimerase/dehydratase family protein n=1 Tax=Streptomyces nondiastaticus TaxID=3154512 RepID=UPI003445D7C4